MTYSEKGMNWCGKYNHEIDDTLVRAHKDDCVKEQNGCGNCPYVCYHLEQVGTGRGGAIYADMTDAIEDLLADAVYEQEEREEPEDKEQEE